MALPRYQYNVSHTGLGKFRVVSGTDEALVLAKVRALEDSWDAEFAKKQAAQNAEDERKQKKQNAVNAKKQALENNLQEADERTEEAESKLNQVANILKGALSLKHEVNWESLKRKNPYPTPKPDEPVYLEFPREPQPNDRRYLPVKQDPIFVEFPTEPKVDDAKYRPVLTTMDKVLNRIERKTQAAYDIYLQDHSVWEESVKNIATENQRLIEVANQHDIENQQRLKELFLKEQVTWADYVKTIEAQNQKIYAETVAQIEAWNAGASAYQQQLDQENVSIDKRKIEYESFQSDAVSDYCELVLSASEYPESFPKEFEFEYVHDTKILVTDYTLPAPEHLPRIKEVKYIKIKDEMVEVKLSDLELNRLYDDTLYQICLRTLYELFDADTVNALGAIVFNGWVKSIDKATGKEANSCVISVQATKVEFQKIALGNVDPKACFKAMKGIGSSKLHSLTAVAPVLEISREDKRFIPSREVENQLNAGFNLAAMDWEDFEQLVREIFEKEFNKGGGEVKVTQASRDGGVDAVAFDPDPIHGGKVVIQAKRYTNTVGVGFVRELWGTVLNEGAMKGILITTADYGPDAYEFAKGKPIVLMNGANLLYLLEKHGRKARIDIKEAKKLLGEKNYGN